MRLAQALSSPLAKHLGLKGLEAKNFALLFVLFFITTFGLIQGRTARDSLFIVRLGADYLPLMYVINAVFVVLVSLVYGRLLSKIHPRKLFSITLICLGVGLITCRLMIQFGLPHGVGVLYVFSQIAWVLSFMQFWILASEVFDARLAKRVFPLIGTGGLSAVILGGVSTAFLVKQLGKEGVSDLIYLWALLLFLSIPFFRKVVDLNHLGRRVMEGVTKKVSPLRDLKKSKYLRVFTINTGLLWFAIYLIDYLFSLFLQREYKDPTEMTVFLGVFQSCLGAVAFLVQIFITPRALKKFGVAGSSLFYPFFVLFALVGFLISKSFWMALLLKFTDVLFFTTIHDAVYQLLYNPIPDRVRNVYKSFLEGGVKPCAIACSGIVILALNSFGFGEEVIPWLAFVVTLLWIVGTKIQRGSYAETLLESLQSGGRALKAETIAALRLSKDMTLYNQLVEKALAAEPTRALSALDLYETLEGPKKLLHLEKLLNHPSNQVKARVLSWIAKDLEKEGRLKGYLKNPARELQLQALVSLGECSPLSSEELSEWSESTDRQISIEAQLQSIRTHQKEGSEEVSLLYSKLDPEGRGYLLTRMAELKMEGFHKELSSSLRSKNDEEFKGSKKLACTLAGKSSLGVVLELLKTPLRGLDAEEIMREHKEESFVILPKEMRSDWSEPMLLRWPRLFIETGGVKAVDQLIASLSGQSPRIKKLIVLSLVKAEAKISLGNRNEQDLRVLLKDSLSDCFKNRLALSSLEVDYGQEQVWPLLKEVVEQRFFDMRSTALFTLGLVNRRGEECSLLEPKLNLKYGRARARALETLENITSQSTELGSLIEFYEHGSGKWPKTAVKKAKNDRSFANIYNKGLPWERWVVSHLDGVKQPEDNVSSMINLDHYFFLQSTGLFSGLRKEDLYSITELTRELSYNTGEEIFHEGDEGNSLFIITKGEVEILVDTPEGAKKVARLGINQCFGDMALLDEEKRSATVVAANPLSCLILEKTDFQHLLDERPGISKEIIQFLVRRLRDANKK